MKERTITLTLTGKTDWDLDLGLTEAMSKITDEYTSGGEKNSTGSYRFEVKNEVITMTEDEISREARTIAKHLETWYGDSAYPLICRDFRIDTLEMDSDDFRGYIPGDLSSVIQLMIDDRGGVENDGHLDILTLLADHFGTPGIVNLLNEPDSPAFGH